LLFGWVGSRALVLLVTVGLLAMVVVVRLDAGIAFGVG